MQSMVDEYERELKGLNEKYKREGEAMEGSYFLMKMKTGKVMTISF